MLNHRRVRVPQSGGSAIVSADSADVRTFFPEQIYDSNPHMRSIGIQIAANAAYGIKPLRRLRDRKLLANGYDADKDASEYVKGVFSKHARCLPSIHGNILEIGPGGNFGPILLFLDAGAERGTAIDVFPWATDQMRLYRQLVDEPEHLMKRFSYRCPDEIEYTSLAAGSFDFIYSQACLEHVNDPVAATTSIARLLAPGGYTSHQIDLRDHRDMSRPLAFLRYSDRVWRAAVSRCGYTNRWRASDWVKAFEANGLRVTSAQPTGEFIQVSERQRSAMNHRFQAKTLDDLGTTGLLITALKPG